MTATTPSKKLSGTPPALGASTKRENSSTDMNRRALLAGAAALPAISLPALAGADAHERALVERWQAIIPELDVSGPAFSEACENGGNVEYRHAHDPVFRTISDRYDAACEALDAFHRETEDFIPTTPDGLALLALICQDANPRSWDEPSHDLDYNEFAMRRLVENVLAFAGMEVPA